MIYGYARVSSKGQDIYGNGLEVQREQLLANGAQEIFCESFTGTQKHRPELDRLMGALKSGDTVLVTKLDRIARSVHDGLEIIDELVEKGVAVDILNMGKFSNSPTSKTMRTIFLAFAEFEHDMILLRTAEGKEICRKTRPDWHDGRKKKEIPEFEEYLEKQKNGLLTASECCRELGISRSTWYARVREREEKNSRAGT